MFERFELVWIEVVDLVFLSVMLCFFVFFCSLSNS